MDQVSAGVFETYSGALKGLLLQGEIPVAVGEANWVQLSERRGRGGGEGVLMLTDRNVTFYSPFGESLRIPLHHVTSTKKTRIVIPRFVELHVFAGPSRSEIDDFSFYCTKRTCRVLQGGIGR